MPRMLCLMPNNLQLRQQTSMNAIEDNAITQQWKMLGKAIPRPKAILSISAHWYTGGSFVQDLEQPEQIYDMYGFPAQLYEVKYPVSGSPVLSRRVKELLGLAVSVDNSWGIDHESDFCSGNDHC